MGFKAQIASDTKAMGAHTTGRAVCTKAMEVQTACRAVYRMCSTSTHTVRCKGLVKLCGGFEQTTLQPVSTHAVRSMQAVNGRVHDGHMGVQGSLHSKQVGT